MSGCGYLQSGKCTYYTVDTDCKSSVCPIINFTVTKGDCENRCSICNNVVLHDTVCTQVICDDCKNAILKLRKRSQNRSRMNKLIKRVKNLFKLHT